ncbi:MAG: 50S ribosomal protein L4 [Chloroflexota bacterium]|nr:50S ribosomal protein L4 [Chloroflexota bacterium]
MEHPVINQRGDTIETIELNDDVFSVPINNTLIHQAVVIYQGNKRQGTHDTKTRAQVSGGGRKPWTQKHTGRARQGSTRSPQWRHGGVVFGPHPRDYRKAIPRKMRRKALKCVLSEKIRQNNFICLDSTDELNGKTQSMTTLLNNLGISNSTLIITANAQENVFRAGHNVPKLWTTPVNLLNANDVLNYQTIIMTVDAAKLAEEMWADPIGHRQKRASANIMTTDETRRSPEPDLTSETTPNQDAPARSRRQRQAPATQTGEETPTTTTRRRRTSTATQSDEETPPTPRRRRTSQTEPEVEQ